MYSPVITIAKEKDMVFQVTEGEDFTYELFSVVIHSGGAHGGHYHAYIRDIDGLGNWVTPVSTLNR